MLSPIRVVIVIPTLNAGPGLDRLLDAIGEQDPSPPVAARNGNESGSCQLATQIVAIDSGSTDSTRPTLLRRGAVLLTVPRAEFNHGETRNAALAAADADFAVLMVQDALPASRAWLASLLQPLLEDATIAGSYARQRPWSNASRITAHYLSNWAATSNEPRVVGPLTCEQFEALTPVDRHLTCVFDNVCSCIRMSVWRAHPFRRTRIAEDLEWALEVLQSGHRLAFVPDAVVWHSHERSVSYELRRTYVCHQRLQTLFGLSTVPTLGALGRAIASTLPLHLRLAAGERENRASALARAAGLAVALPLGQYLGARSAREGREFLDADGV
jgi:glycosyltransferase involved in cell wall biosynthesis